MKPILFNTGMVRAILDGRKTVTRRVIKPQPEMDLAYIMAGYQHGKWSYSPYVRPTYDDYKHSPKYWSPPCHTDDILYVREAWRFSSVAKASIKTDMWRYKADDPEWFLTNWRPSIHMPKEAARIFLRVTNVRVERLQDIMDDPPGPENQIVREGFRYGSDFIATWQNTIKPADLDTYGWDANPWVWVIEFERCEKPKEG